MFVLGIDPGLTLTGYGLVRRRSSLEAVAAGVIRTDPGASTPLRLLELHRQLTDLVRQHQPEVMAIEQVFTNRNRQTAISVGRAAGVAILVAAEAGLPVFEYVPTMVKLAVTGDGAAGKPAVQAMVQRRLRLASPPSPPDAADALATAICHLQSIQLAAG
ncbi:MAG TPA: crossover junction endodeoxyribonuclease RuvC [Acidimicrobiia bacterium]|jgi:crossover junction endodeoxyribonuclease RuvC